jgi:hypothetical protein
VSPRTGLDDMEKRKFLTYRDSNSDRSVVQPVARRYPGSPYRTLDKIMMFLIFIFITWPLTLIHYFTYVVGRLWVDPTS